MRMEQALAIIACGQEEGYMVSFEKRVAGMIHSDYFPDKHRGEPLIGSLKTAWELAEKFAAATNPEVYVNIYVVRANFTPVDGYKEKMLRRYPA